MRLSEAMRLGAMDKPQVFGSFSREIARRSFHFHLYGAVHLCVESEPATCALGAALDANGGFRTVTAVAEQDMGSVRGYVKAGQTYRQIVIPEEWTTFIQTPSACPACEFECYLGNVVMHLNDRHRWTREQIADWVAIRERAVETDDSARLVALRDQDRAEQKA